MDVFVIKEVLEDCGMKFSLRLARNGQEALHFLQDLNGNEGQSCPDLVLLDLNLPKVAGIEVLRELRASSPCKDTPVIVVTSSTASADRAAVQRLGAQAYFQKPTDLKAYMELAVVIKRVLKIGE